MSDTPTARAAYTKSCSRRDRKRLRTRRAKPSQPRNPKMSITVTQLPAPRKAEATRMMNSNGSDNRASTMRISNQSTQPPK